jgi:acyl carrier protein
MATFEQVRKIVAESLEVGDRLDHAGPESALLGGIPEFDSMAVLNVITALENNLGITIDDDDISAEVFETLGSLASFVNVKN